jgi:hypothetical protein
LRLQASLLGLLCQSLLLLLRLLQLLLRCGACIRCLLRRLFRLQTGLLCCLAFLIR